MTTQYTTILKLALPVQGELSGSWGDVVNDNITEMVEEAVAGLATINSWTANSHTLTTVNGTTSESRCAVLVADDDGGGNPSAAATIICPSATKLYVLKNISGQQVTLKTAAGTGVAVPNGSAAFLFCDGTNVEACQTDIIDATTIDTTNLEVTNIKAKDGTASGSIANSTGVFTINSAVLTTADINGGTIDGTVIGGASAAAGTFTTITTSGNVGITGTLSSTGTHTVGTNSSGNSATLQQAGGFQFKLNGDTASQLGTVSWVNNSGTQTGNIWGTGDSSGSTVLRVKSLGIIDLVPGGVGIDGTEGWRHSTSSLTAPNAAGPALMNEAASSTNPTLVPNKADLDTGVGWASANVLTAVTGGSERMRIDSSGNVGIGTSSPDRLFEVEEASGDAYIRLRASDTGGGADTIFENLVADNGQNNYIYFGDLDDTNIGMIRYSHATDVMSFTTNAAESMRITSTGNVGIGTTAPAEKLEVTGNLILDATDADIKLKSGGAGTTGAVRWTFSSNSTSYGDISLPYDTRASVGLLLHTIGGYPITIDSGNSVIFKEDSTETMRITPTGNVGIGTASPAKQLHITKAAIAAIGTLTDGATITPDFDANQNFSVTLAGNRTLANPTNIDAGQTGSIFITQDGTGGRTLSFGSYWDFAGGTAPTLSTGAGAVDRIDYIVRTGTSIHAVATLNLS